VTEVEPQKPVRVCALAARNPPEPEMRVAAHVKTAGPDSAGVGGRRVYAGIISVAAATVWGVLFNKHGRRALALGFAQGNPNVVFPGEGMDFWYYVAAAVIWELLLFVLLGMSAYAFEETGKKWALVRTAVSDVFRLTMFQFWWGFLSGPLEGWIATGMISGTPGTGTSSTLNNDSVGFMALSTVFSSLALGFGWAFWDVVALSGAPDVALMGVEESAAKDGDAPKTPAQQSFADKYGKVDLDSKGMLGRITRAVDRAFVFLPASIVATFVMHQLATWWVVVPFARGSFAWEVGCNFAATIVIVATIYMFRGLVPAERWALTRDAVLKLAQTVRASFGVFVTICIALWVTTYAVPALSRVMTNEPPPAVSTNPLCPTRVDVYPANYAGEVFALLAVALCIAGLLYASFVTFGARSWGKSRQFWNLPMGWSSSTKVAASAAAKLKLNGEVTTEVAESGIVLDHVDGVHPFTWTVGFAVGTLLAEDGSIALLQNSHAFCNPDQHFASRIAGVAVVSLLLGVLWFVVYMSAHKAGWKAAEAYLVAEDPAVLFPLQVGVAAGLVGVAARVGDARPTAGLVAQRATGILGVYQVGRA